MFIYKSVVFLFCTLQQLQQFAGKSFGKASRTFGLDKRKSWWVVKQDFHGNFQANLTWFFAFFFFRPPCTVSKISSPYTSYVTKFSLPLKLIMSQVVEGMWIYMGSYGKFRGNWVNYKQLPLSFFCGALCGFNQ